MIKKKWLRRMAGFLVFFTLFPGGMSGPVPAHAQAAAPAAEVAAEVPIESAIAARLAAERPELGEGDRRQIAAAIACEAVARGIDPWLVYAVIEVESEFDIDAHGGSGERGLMQVLPSTARAVQRALAPGEPPVTPEELERPEVNIRLGTVYLADQMRRYGGDEGLALTAYNAGRAKGVPSPYARRVLARYSRYAIAFGPAAPPAAPPPAPAAPAAAAPSAPRVG